MRSYSAFLRGIYPGNPNMRNEKLREVFHQLGFGNVASLMASGNILFSSDDDSSTQLESSIQSALRRELEIDGGTIVRSRAEIQRLVDRNPFKGLEHSKATYLAVTFFKDAPPEWPVPPPQIHEVRVKEYDAEARALLAVIDSTEGRMPDYMAWLQQQFGREITTRTWNTVLKVLKKMPTA